MSQVNLNYRDSFTNSLGDESLSGYTYTSSIRPSTFREEGPVRSVEFPLFMGGPSYGSWSNEHLPTAGPHSAMNHPNYPPQVSYTSTTGHDSPLHTITLAEHRGNETNNHNYYVPIAPGPDQLEYYAPSPVAPDVPNDDPTRYAPILDNVAGPSGNNSSPVHPGIPDDEDLKRLARRYLNDPGSHIDKLLIRRHFPGGRRVLILLEIDDIM